MNSATLASASAPALEATEDRPARLRRIRRLSAVMTWGTTGLAVAMGLIVTLAVIWLAWPALFPQLADELFEIAETERNLLDIPLSQRLGLALLGAVGGGLITLILVRLRQIFAGFQRMEFFAAQTLGKVIALGRTLLVFGVFDIFHDPLGTLLMTLDLPEGQRTMELSLDGGEIFVLIFGAIMLTFGWILREAALTHEENQQFI